jgi:hypothetical protein
MLLSNILSLTVNTLLHEVSQPVSLLLNMFDEPSGQCSGVTAQ